MPQILVGDTNYLQVLVQHRPIPLPGRQTHRECSHGLSLSGRQSQTTTSHEHHTPGETPQHQPDRPNRATTRNRSGNPGEGLRIGELCGLHLVDLHLREDAACGQCRSPHLHVCHRPDNANHAEAKTKHPWWVDDGIVTGGLVKRVSPAMIHTYFEYITTEYPRGSTDHGMLLVQLHGASAGQPLAPAAARGMLARAGKRSGLGLIRPHTFRHSFTSAVLDASGGNLVIARDAGGWASAAMVDEIYGHVDVHDPKFDKALRTAWGEA
jgi:integrase